MSAASRRWAVAASTGLVAATTLFAGTAWPWPVPPPAAAPCEAGQACAGGPSDGQSPAPAPAEVNPPESPSPATPSPATGDGTAVGVSGATQPAPVVVHPVAPVAPAPGRPAADTEEPKIRRRLRPVSSAAPSVVSAGPEIPDRVFILSVGTHVFLGRGGDNTDPGFRVGALAGGRVGDSLSANAELVIDFVNPQSSGSSASVSEQMFDLTFSPLIHAPLGPNTEFVLGPRLGLFYLTSSVSSGGFSASASGWGLAVGANAGALVSFDRVRFGLLMSFGVRSPSEICVTQNGGEMCVSDNLSSAKTMGIALALML